MTVVRSKCQGVQMHGDHMFWGTKIIGPADSEVILFDCTDFHHIPRATVLDAERYILLLRALYRRVVSILLRSWTWPKLRKIAQRADKLPQQ